MNLTKILNNLNFIKLIVRFCISVFLFLSLTSCAQEKEALKIYLPNASISENFDEFEMLVEKQLNIPLEIYHKTDSNLNPIELLSQREIDFTVIANSAPFTKNINVVLPVYRGILHVLVRDELVFEKNEDFFLNHSIYINDDTAVARSFLEFIAKRNNLDEKNLNIVEDFEPGETDVIMLFAPILEDVKIFKGYRLLSYGKVENLGKGSRVEAISHFIPQMMPFIIPANTYPGMPGNQNAVLTIAVDMLLVTHDEVEEDVIRSLAQLLMERRTELSLIMPDIFYSLTDTFDPLNLKFPLHQGAKSFIERKQPTMFEKYADVINLILYLMVLFVSGLIAFVRWNKQKRKDKIDEFYEKLFVIRDALRDGIEITEKECNKQLREIEREAFQLLIDEKISADSSFIIFETLLHDTTDRVREQFI